MLLLILYFVRDISCLSFSALSQHSLLFESHVFHVGFFCRFNEDDCNENHIGAKLSSWALFRCNFYLVWLWWLKKKSHISLQLFMEIWSSFCY